MTKADRNMLEVDLLRPIDWIDENEVRIGGTIYLDLEEMGAIGYADVLSVSACPEIAAQPSVDHQIVTGTFVHSTAELLVLNVEGLSEQIRTTDYHRFWSEDRRNFVAARDLVIGESLRFADGSSARILSLDSVVDSVPVHNLEVNRSHVYYVGSKGILVHNDYAEEAVRVLAVAGHRFPATDYLDELIQGAKRSNQEWDFPHQYVNPGRHDPSEWGHRYVPDKSVLPPDHIALFLRSVVDPDDHLTRWAIDAKGQIHRFQGQLSGRGIHFHWNGQENGLTRDGVPRVLEQVFVARGRRVLRGL
jgi:hypothetical protein